jgi:hypothetical protein
MTPPASSAVGGPTTGLAGTLRLKLIGMAETIYGLLLVLSIIFLPWGGLGRALARPSTPVGRARSPEAAA